MRIYNEMHQFNFMEKKLPVYKLEISEDINSEQEVNAVALVDIPAIGEGFFAFKAESQSFTVVNEEERIVVGPAMIPDKLIYRNEKDSAGNIIAEYNVTFGPKTIQQIAQKFFAKNFQNNGNEMHDPEKPVDMVYFQSWIADESKGIPKMKQFESLPDGTWFLGAKVNSDEAWQKVKDGTFRGFSVEGMFDMIPVKMGSTPENILEQLKELLKGI
jgi:hypothetical protein